MRFMLHRELVEVTSPRRSHWVARAPKAPSSGMPIAYDTAHPDWRVNVDLHRRSPRARRANEKTGSTTNARECVVARGLKGKREPRDGDTHAQTPVPPAFRW